MKKAESQKLDAYRGTLSIPEIAHGINLAKANAQRLAQDARTLFDLGRFPTAASLAALSIEESGKVPILRRLALAKSEQEIAVCWKHYRSHTKKNIHWTLPELFVAGARTLDEFRPLFEENASHPKTLDLVKQLGFYTDCLGDRNWSAPTVVICEDISRSLVLTAAMFAENRDVTPREIELWVQYLGSSPMEDLDKGKEALIAWYAAMQDEGLVNVGTNVMEQMIKRGIGVPENQSSTEKA